MDKIVKTIPKITVLMPVYNCELYIQEAVDSILNQTFSNFEFLIIDDASTDKTVEIIQEYNDSRIQLIIKPQNTGLSNSLNYGLSIARGEYIARMDGDDISLPERFAKQVAFLEDNPDVVVCGTIFSIIGSNTVITVPENNDAIKLAMLKKCCIGHPTVMMRKNILDKYSITYDVLKEPAEDYDLWSRLLFKGKFHNLQEVLLKYRVHDAQVSSKRFGQQLTIAAEIKFSLLCFPNLKIKNDEIRVLRKFIKDEEIIDFKEIKLFLKIKKKIIHANVDGFFEPIGFQLHFCNFEKKNIQNYFLIRDSFSPLVYFNYLIVRNKTSCKITIVNEFKLLIKSLIFWKIS